MGSKVKGFTLIEIMVSIVLLTIMMIPVGLVMMEYARSTTSGGHIVQALDVARRDISAVDLLPFNDASFGTADSTRTDSTSPSGMLFDVRRRIYDLNLGGITQPDARKVIIDVSLSPCANNPVLVELETHVIRNNDTLFGLGKGQLLTGIPAFFYSTNSWTTIRSGDYGNRYYFFRPDLINRSPTDSITLTGVIITNKSPDSIKLREYRPTGGYYYRGSIIWDWDSGIYDETDTLLVNTPLIITLNPSVTIAADTIYTRQIPTAPKTGIGFSFENSPAAHTFTVQYKLKYTLNSVVYYYTTDPYTYTPTYVYDASL